jgi:hydrophobic/amphiphilic exporter-1 (mainly G- bacteria), HAE1 family
MWLLTRLSLASRSLVALMTLVIIGFGLFAVPSLREQLIPSIELPTVAVTAQYAGASPQVVEDQVTTPIETAVSGLSGLDTTTSTSSQGQAVVELEFVYGTDVDQATTDVERKVDALTTLPTNATTSVVTGSTDDIPAITLAATGSASQQQLADRLDNDVVPALEKIDGVREADVTGVRTQNVVITLDQAKLAAAGVSASSITTALQENGVAVPAGTLNQSDKSLAVQVGGKLTSLADIRNLYLTPGTGSQSSGSARSGGATGNSAAQPVRLGDVATVTLKSAERTSLTRTNGKPSLGVSVTLTPDGNAVSVSHDVRNQLSDLSAKLGNGGKLTVVSDQAPSIQSSISDLLREGGLGLLFAVLVILIFLLSVRSTLVTAVSIPMSVLIALIVMWATGETLNMLTLGGLTIAIGRVVDDSIVVLENIKRHLGYGESKQDAVLTGVREVAGAVTASTLTTIAVFLPIAFVGGIVGELFRPFAITVVVALLASLLVALALTPVLAYWFLKPSTRAARAPGVASHDASRPYDQGAEVRDRALARERRNPLQRVYVPVLRFTTRHRATTVLIAFLLLIFTLAMVPSLQTSFLGDTGTGTFTISQKMPAGSSLSRTDAASHQVENILAHSQGIDSYQLTSGSSGGALSALRGGGADTSKANFSVAATEGTDVTALESTLRHKFQSLPASAGTITFGGGGLMGGGGSDNQLAVTVTANDQNTLRTAADQVQHAMAGLDNVTDVESDLSTKTPQVHVTVDRKAAARYGLSDTTIGQLVAEATQGSQVGTITLDGTEDDIVLSTGTSPTDLDGLRALTIPTTSGTVTLGQVATVSEVRSAVTISRTDGNRTATITGTATGSDTGAVSSALNSALKKLTLPSGASYSVGGVTANMSDSFGDLGLAVLAAIAIVFMIMAATFRSLAQPLILLVSIPFAATGAIGALLLTDTPLGLSALIGVLMLVGIVVTNAIVLIDLINQYRARGMSVADAVVEGGRRRLRPIVMTAAATICALIPMAAGLTGSGNAFISQPLAVVVIGGLISSTLLTLILVPTLYTAVEIRKERRRLRRAPASPVPAPSQPQPVS